MKKLLACVLACGLCTFTVDALTGLKNKAKKLASKLGSAVEKKLTGDSETQQKIQNLSSALVDEFSKIQESVKKTKESVDESNSKSIKGGEETYNSVINSISNSITLLENVPIDAPKTILPLHTGLSLIIDTIEKIQGLKIETKKDDANDSSNIEESVIPKSTVNNLSKACLELKKISTPYFLQYTNILQKMVNAVKNIEKGSSDVKSLSDKVQSFIKKLKTKLEECKKDLYKLVAEDYLTSISTDIDDLEKEGINIQTLRDNYNALEKLINPTTKALQQIGNNLTNATINAGVNIANSTTSTAATKMGESVESLRENVDKAVNYMEEETSSKK